MVRLLHVRTLQLHEFTSGNTPPYVIASHRWGESESTFQDVLLGQNKDTPGFHKIEAFCDQIRSVPGSGEFPWLWIDTCCIGWSSARRSSPINSMFKWYTNSYICLAYLQDVSVQDGATSLKRSTWFTRGWTLQELLAPHIVIFLDRDWQTIGHKHHTNPKRVPEEFHCGHSLNQLLSSITRVPEEILLNYELSATVSKEEKQAWLKGRSTTRPEDMAYCMLGLFRISMPPLYGEGKSRSWRRLDVELRRLEEGSSSDSSDEAEAPYGRLIDGLPGRRRYVMTSKPRTEVVGTQPTASNIAFRSELARLHDEITALKKQLEGRVDDEVRVAMRLALAHIQDRQSTQPLTANDFMPSKFKPAATGWKSALPWVSRKTCEHMRIEYENRLAEAEAAKEVAVTARMELEEQIENGKSVPDSQREPIMFKDAVGRRFSFPWLICNTWQGMESLIKQAFLYVDMIGEHVHQGHYDLLGPNGEIILPQVWDAMIEPGWEITMHLWPMQEEQQPSAQEPLMEFGSPGPGDLIIPPLADVGKGRSSRKASKRARKPSSSLSESYTGLHPSGLFAEDQMPAGGEEGHPRAAGVDGNSPPQEDWDTASDASRYLSRSDRTSTISHAGSSQRDVLTDTDFREVADGDKTALLARSVDGQSGEHLPGEIL